MIENKFTDYRVYCTKGNGWVAALFNYLDRAQKWIEVFNPNIYMDKTLTKNDFVIQGSNDFKSWEAI